jgi:hypothetical protein
MGSVTMSDFTIATVDSKNVEELGFFCVKNEKHPGYAAKLSWLKQRFTEGLRIKLLLTEDGKKAGFLEYIPGEYTWRVVHAPDCLVIHCLWVNSKKFPVRGMASALLEESLNDAESNGKRGIAVVTSDGPWMVRRDVFIKNGFELLDEAQPHYQLLFKRTGTNSLPAFPPGLEERLSKSRGLRLFYANQCPYIGKAVKELPPVAERHGIKLHLVELKDAADVRERMPTPYGVINLIYQGRLLADHPISATRFRNILQKELNLSETDGS